MSIVHGTGWLVELGRKPGIDDNSLNFSGTLRYSIGFNSDRNNHDNNIDIEIQPKHMPAMANHNWWQTHSKMDTHGLKRLHSGNLSI